MSTESPESRLRETLTTVANSTSPDLEFAQIVARLDTEPTSSTSNRRWLLAAAAGLVVVAGSFAWLGSNSDNTFELDSAETTEIQQDDLDRSSTLVLPGEAIVSLDPLIVHATQGPEPQFDTSDLGDEVGFLPITQPDINQMLDRVNVEENAANGIHVKTILLGWVEGAPVVVNIVDDVAGSKWEEFNASDPTDIVRRRTVMSSLGGMTQYQAVEPGSLRLIQQQSVESGNIDPYPFILPADGLVLWSQLPVETAVVALTREAGPVWMRPRNGVAAFRSGLSPGETVVLRAMDVDGKEILRREAQIDDTQVTATEYVGAELLNGRFDEATPPPSHYVLEGETVLGEDPLIVLAAPAPKPRFDTSDLGTEVVIGDLSACPSLEELYDSWWSETIEEYPEAIFIKFTVIGSVGDGCVWTAVADHRFGFGSSAKSPDTNVRNLTMGWSNNVTITAGNKTDRESLEFIENPPFGDPSGQAAVFSSGGMWAGFPPEVAVVVLETDDGMFWTQPRAGVAFLTGMKFRTDGSFSSVLDADGNELFRPVGG